MEARHLKSASPTPAAQTDDDAALRAAFTEASSYAAAVARDAPDPTDPAAVAAHDLADGTLIVDAHGLTVGARRDLVDPVRRAWARWQALHDVFMARIEPRLGDIDAVGRLPAAIATLQAKRADEIAILRDRWAEQPRHGLIARQWDTAQAVYATESARHNQRLANMAALSPLYWAGLLLIGVAEWLINYDTFFVFTGVVAIAVGATAILAVLLAFAAHGHGELLKQWSYRFGRFQTRQARVGAWRMLALSTVAVLVVLAAAGGSRYAAVLRSLSAAQQPDIIGGGYALQVNPARDVLLSLLANIAAWIVGVFISYFCHDVDPDFMAATWQHRRTSRAYFRARRRLEQDIQVIQERTARDVTALDNIAASRSTGADAERRMLIQIGQHGSALADVLLARLGADLQRHRSALVAGARHGDAILLQDAAGGTEPLSPDRLAALPLPIDRSLLGAA